MKIEGVVYVLSKKLIHLRCHVYGTSGINLRFKVERINAFRLNVFLPDARRSKSVRFENFRHRLHIFMCAESVNAVAMPILSVRMAMLSRKNTGAAHGA